MLVYFVAVWNILQAMASWPFGIFRGNLVHFPRFGCMLYLEKFGNPVVHR
jgi:hypothetical protein